MGFDLSDYVTVPERIAEFRAKYPDGSLQVRLIELPEAFAATFIAVEARAFRHPDDERPGIDIAWEPVPGKTPYTRDSEAMNASTSAVGRAIVYALAADTKKGISSAEEVQSRKQDQPSGEGSTDQGEGATDPSPSSPPSNSDERWKEAVMAYGTRGKLIAAASEKFGVATRDSITDDQLAELIKAAGS